MRLKLRTAFFLATLYFFTSFSLQAQDMKYARQVVNKLASKAFKGRGYEQSGALIASEYIAAEFRKSGLSPLNDGSYFQEFKIPVNTFPGKMNVRLNDQLLTPAADYLIDASSPPVHGTFPLHLVNSQDLSNPEKLGSLISQAQDAFLGVDLRNAQGNKQAVQKVIDDLQQDDKNGIKGLVVFTTEKLTWTTLSFQTKVPLLTVNKKDLEPASINSIAVDIDARFIPDLTTRNVAGMVKGTSNSDSTIVISAHYDHLGMMGENVYFPGANDNASGTAMMLNLARHYAKHPPKYNTVFLAFSGEEIGLLGSKAFVEQPLIPLKQIRFLLNLDLAGTGEEGIKVVNGSIFKPQFDTLTALNNQYKLLPKVDIRGEACNSDHCRFYALGVPCFFIYTQGGIQAYHDIHDRPETLPLTAFAPYFQLMVKFLSTF
jgi:aminopeptidase YwaD